MRVHAQRPDEVFHAAAHRIVAAIGRYADTHGDCVLGIVGGRVVPGLLHAIAAELIQHPFKGVLHVFWLDERVDHDKNFFPDVPHLELLYHAGADVRLYPFVGLDTETIMAEAKAVLRRLSALRGRPAFDLVLLSAGEDGHVASLFPQHRALHAHGRKYVLVDDAPKDPPVRVTVTPQLLLTGEAFLFFVGDKWDAYARFLDPAVPVQECPAKLLRGATRLTTFVALR